MFKDILWSYTTHACREIKHYPGVKIKCVYLCQWIQWYIRYRHSKLHTYAFASKPSHTVDRHCANVPPLSLLCLAKSEFKFKRKERSRRKNSWAPLCVVSVHRHIQVSRMNVYCLQQRGEMMRGALVMALPGRKNRMQNKEALEKGQVSFSSVKNPHDSMDTGHRG